MQDYFPSKLALGESFYNRIKEKEALRKNIAKARHLVLVSPRRYGKSSLVHTVVQELGAPFASIDLFLAHDDLAITKRLLTGISQAVSAMMPPEQKILQTLQTLFSKCRVRLSALGFSIEATYEAGSTTDAVDHIFSALSALAELARTTQQKVIFFIDEFQDIAAAESAKSIQGAIRHVAQLTSDIVFIFSGSNRHLLLELFDDKSMPLYMLCDKMHLERMSSNDYRAPLQKRAHMKWGSALSDPVFTRIMVLTELHPFYVNLLCNQLWDEDTPPTSEQQVDNAWQCCYDNEERRLVAELEKFTKNQQDLLKALACEPTTTPTAQKFMARTHLAYSSIRQTLKVLFEKDMVYTVKWLDESIPLFKKDQIRVLDPLLSFALRHYS